MSRTKTPEYVAAQGETLVLLAELSTYYTEEKFNELRNSLLEDHETGIIDIDQVFATLATARGYKGRKPAVVLDPVVNGWMAQIAALTNPDDVGFEGGDGTIPVYIAMHQIVRDALKENPEITAEKLVEILKSKSGELWNKYAQLEDVNNPSTTVEQLLYKHSYNLGTVKWLIPNLFGADPEKALVTFGEEQRKFFDGEIGIFSRINAAANDPEGEPGRTVKEAMKLQLQRIKNLGAEENNDKLHTKRMAEALKEDPKLLERIYEEFTGGLDNDKYLFNPDGTLVVEVEGDRKPETPSDKVLSAHTVSVQDAEDLKAMGWMGWGTMTKHEALEKMPFGLSFPFKQLIPVFEYIVQSVASTVAPATINSWKKYKSLIEQRGHRSWARYLLEDRLPEIGGLPPWRPAAALSAAYLARQERLDKEAMGATKRWLEDQENPASEEGARGDAGLTWARYLLEGR